MNKMKAVHAAEWARACLRNHMLSSFINENKYTDANITALWREWTTFIHTGDRRALVRCARYVGGVT